MIFSVVNLSMSENNISDLLQQAHEKLHEIDRDLRDEVIPSKAKSVLLKYKNLIKSKMVEIRRLLADNDKKELKKLLDGLKSIRIADPKLQNNGDLDTDIGAKIEEYKTILEDTLPRIKGHLSSHGGSRRVKRAKRGTRRLR